MKINALEYGCTGGNKTNSGGGRSWGVMKDGRRAGFARLVTDYATFGYLADVNVVEAYRGEGKMLR